MEPIKIAGLTLKSEVPSGKDREEDAIIEDSDAAFANSVPEDWEGLTEEIELPITFQLEHLIKCVEELPKSDTSIKALGKLKGALQLLS